MEWEERVSLTATLSLCPRLDCWAGRNVTPRSTLAVTQEDSCLYTDDRVSMYKKYHSNPKCLDKHNACQMHLLVYSFGWSLSLCGLKVDRFTVDLCKDLFRPSESENFL